LLLTESLTGVRAAPQIATITPLFSTMKRCYAPTALFISAGIALVGTARGQTNTFPSSGSVGIGTTTPSYTLQISQPTGYNAWEVLERPNSSQIGVLGFLTGSTSDWALGEADTGSGASDFGIFNYYASSNAISILHDNSNVGIGTTSPQNKLTVLQSSGGSGYGGTDGTGGIRVAWSSGYGASLDAWDGASPRWGVVRFVENTPTVLIEGVYNNNNVIFNSGGNVGIGTTNPTYPLSVNGTVEAKEVIVQTGWSDYVFDKGYRLAPLSEVERTIETQKRLSGMPSAREVAAHGVKMGEMEAKLLEKIEELTLHVIDEEKRLNTETKRIDQLEEENEQLRVAH